MAGERYGRLASVALWQAAVNVTARERWSQRAHASPFFYAAKRRDFFSSKRCRRGAMRPVRLLRVCVSEGLTQADS